MNETWLAHHGIKGQKWGVRRFENSDGTLTEAGKKRYSKGDLEKKQRVNNALKVGGVLAGASVLKSAISIGLAKKGVEFVSDGELTVNPLKAIPGTIIKAGKAFVIGGVAGYGVTAFRQDQKAKRSSLISEQKIKKPSGAMVDGYKKTWKPSGAIS